MKKCTINTAHAPKGIASVNFCKRIIAACLLAGLLFLNNSSSIAQANTELSNLASTTKVNVNLLPTSDNTKNLGSATKSWKDLYLDGYLYVDGLRFISNTGTDNVFVGTNAGNLSASGTSNTAIGANAGNTLNLGYENTFVGTSAGSGNGFGYRNTFVGRVAGFSNSWGFNNTFIGEAAGYKNEGDPAGTEGRDNTFIGARAGYNNVTGHYNTFVGANAGHVNTSGSFNTAVGISALHDNTTGDANSMFGDYTGSNTTTGSYNAAFGASAFTLNSTGENNAAFGSYALWGNVSGSYNSMFGSDAGYHTTTSYNSFFGYYAGVDHTSGTDNTLMGALTGFHLTTGSENTFIGQNAGYTLATGSNVTCVGDFARTGSSALNNASAFGSDAVVSASNTVRIGSSDVSSIGGYAGWSNISDGRYKKNIREEVAGLEFISKLRPVIYTLDISGINKFFGGEEEERSLNASRQESIAAKEQIVYTGFIAQEVEATAKEIGYDFSGVDAPKNDHDLYGLRYAEFVVPLVKSVQELTTINDVKDEQIRELQNENAALLLRIENIERQLGISAVNTVNSIPQQAASLEQNIPNPAKNSTTIHFYIPVDIHDAMLLITDASGRSIRQFSHLANGQSEIEFSTADLSSGTYQYSLFVEGRVVDSKQMVVTK